MMSISVRSMVTKKQTLATKNTQQTRTAAAYVKRKKIQMNTRTTREVWASNTISMLDGSTSKTFLLSRLGAQYPKHQAAFHK